MSEVYTNEAREAAVRYLSAGLAVIPVPSGTKNPNRSGWQNERWTVEDVPGCWNNGQGVGALWGAPSGGLVDVDLDWTEAREAAKHILPETRAFGRPGAPESHRVYRVAGQVPPTKRYKLGGDGPERSVVEVLSTGTQSLVPPSLHESGERRAWHRDRSAAEVDAVVLMEGVADVATAALVARNWPGKGSRKDYVMAAAGYVGRRLGRDRAERVMEAAVAVSGDEEAASRLRDVRDTLDAVDAGRPATGGPALDAMVPGVADQLRRWHGWGATSSPTGTPSPLRSFHLTDMGNAERLVARHGDDLLYCKPLGGWLVWDGTRWKRDESGEVERRAKEAVRSIYGEAEKASDDDRRRAIAAHAKASEARVRLDAMVALARSEPGIPVSADALDADPWLLNTLSGTVDLRSGERREHRRDDLLTKLAPVEYDPDATAKRFERFLREVLVQEDLIGFVRRFAGYSLSGSTRERCFAILHGGGKNGKSTLVELLQDALGDYARNTAVDTVLAKRYDGVGNDVAALKGARFVSAAEVERGRKLAESKVKNLTGSDTVTARFLFAEPFDFRPEFKLWLSTNNKPEITGTDDAIWDRTKLVPFNRRFEGADVDTALHEKLREELPGVLAWMVRGCLEWQRIGLREPPVVSNATLEYRQEMDTLAAFIADRCVVLESARVGGAALFAAYDAWRKANNEEELSGTMFGRRVSERFRKTKSPTVVYHGIGFRDDRPDPDGDLEGFDPDSGPEAPSDRSDLAPNPLSSSGPAPNPLSSESPIDKANSGGASEIVRGFGEFNQKVRANVSRVDESLKNPLKPSNPLKPDPHDTPRDLLDAPPPWLARQLALCEDDPQAFLDPTIHAIRRALGDGTTEQEVQHELCRYLSESGAA